MSSEKVVREDLRKLLQKIPASYHLCIFIQLDDNFRSKYDLHKLRFYRFHLKVDGQVLLFSQAVLRVDKYEFGCFLCIV